MRLHLHVSVEDLGRSITFYETLFGTPPSVVKEDYAKWMLEEPRVNLAISQRGRPAGVDHVGIQTETPAELSTLAGRLKAAGEATFDQEATSCCYARSDKSWVKDPSGLSWETFYTFGESASYGEDAVETLSSGACCAPEVAKVEPIRTTSACCGQAA